jgi:hypothetical protein
LRYSGSFDHRTTLTKTEFVIPKIRAADSNPFTHTHTSYFFSAHPFPQTPGLKSKTDGKYFVITTTLGQAQVRKIP